MKWHHWLFLFVIFSLYFYLRFGSIDTIQFGYDQPRLATVIADFLAKGTYLTSQSFALESPWGNISWGPALVFFFAFILKISHDPVVASEVITTLNVFSIVTIIYIGWRFFSPKVGIISGLILATQPWWIIFSRMFYQPSIIPTLVSISMLLMFLVLDKPRSPLASILIFSWALLVQFYLISFSFIATSFVFVLTLIKKIQLSSILVGLLLSFLLFLPSIYYYKTNPEKVQSFLGAPGKFESTTGDIITNYFKTLSGGNIEWELGYGYSDFVKDNAWIKPISEVDLLLVTLVVIFGFLKSFLSKDNKRLRLLVAFWLIAPLWFLSIVKVEYVVPRYFLISLAPLSLLVGITIEDLYKKIKTAKFRVPVFLIPLFLAGSWIFVILSYYKFIENYSYPYGFLSHFSDIPYSFLQKAFSFMGPNKPERGLWAVNYYLDYIDKDGGGKVLYEISFDKPDPEKKMGARFGPYTVYEIKN